jgi:ABC-type multidrug transport system fused ATPase/permease subunit
LRNIAFAEDNEDIDLNLVNECINKAKLTKFINNYGLYAKVGEIGKKISGGEKQRICIARALYKKPKILILDEATSALDLKTERLILDTLELLKKKIIIIFISHKKSSLKICDSIYEIGDKSKFFKIL